MIKAVFFDLDDTLLDYENANEYALDNLYQNSKPHLNLER